MPRYEITAMYEYGGVVEEATEEKAYDYFLHNLNDFYVSTESYDIEEIKEDDDA